MESILRYPDTCQMEPPVIRVSGDHSMLPGPPSSFPVVQANDGNFRASEERTTTATLNKMPCHVGDSHVLMQLSNVTMPKQTFGPEQHFYGNHFNNTVRDSVLPTLTVPNHSFPFPVMPQPSGSLQQLGGRSSNPLRSAIFDKILGSYPYLQRKLGDNKEKSPKRSDCLYATGNGESSVESSLNVSSAIPKVHTSLASDIMEDEMDIGYFSLSDVSSANSSCASPNDTHLSVSTDIGNTSVCDIPEDVFDNVGDITFKDVTAEVGQCDDVSDIIPSIFPTNQSPSTVKFEQNVLSACSDIAQRSCEFSHIGKQDENNSVKYKCNLCDKTFKTISSRNSHISSHNSDKRHKCSVCGKCFAQKSTLRTHIRVHTGERPYACKVCGRTFGDYSTCLKHERTHTGERPYACPICDKRFAQSGNMIRHKLVHEKRKMQGIPL